MNTSNRLKLKKKTRQIASAATNTLPAEKGGNKALALWFLNMKALVRSPGDEVEASMWLCESMTNVVVGRGVAGDIRDRGIPHW